MKTIPLTQGKFAIVDDEDFDRLNKYKWYFHKDNKDRDGGGYAHRAVRFCYKKQRQRPMPMHREILGLTLKHYKTVDHINHNKLDNRKCNLRLCTKRQNSFNRTKHITSKSKYKGIYWNKLVNKWRVSISYNGDYFYLGYFKDEIDAARAYNKKAEELFGEFASLNEF